MQKNLIENNPKAKKIAVAILFGVPILLAIIFEVRYYLVDKEISGSYATTRGVITKVKYGRNALIYWEYEVKGKKYMNYAAETCQFEFTRYCPGESCLGDSVDVEYTAENPERSRIFFHGMRSYR